MMRKNSIFRILLFFLLVFFSFAFICIILYIRRNFALIDTNPISQILFHCIVQIDGADPTFIRGIAIRCFILPLLASIFVTAIVFCDKGFLKNISALKPVAFIRKYAVSISFVLFIISFALISKELKLADYIAETSKTTTLYEDSYIDPSKVDYAFPEKKRNLIYIFLESVETSDYAKQEGGLLEYDCIPELYQIAEENITFNDNKGYYVAPGASWTVASMVAQSSGIPLNIPIGENDFVTSNKYLPGAYSLGEILKQGGYNNELLIGSQAVFSGRKYYYEMHGDYVIHDYDYFLESGRFDQDDQSWWGVVDRYLFEYAKEDALELASKNEPFNLTILTVDTHHVDGWVCEDCRDDFPQQMANVYACSSRKVSDFVNWCKQQDFYENTTIVLVGDHKSMSTGFYEGIDENDRMVYYTYINPEPECIPTNNRIVCTFDFYPTTVASLGIDFPGERLGLGTNLFSDEKTLCESYGIDGFFELVKRRSDYYVNHILYGID